MNAQHPLLLLVVCLVIQNARNGLSITVRLFENSSFEVSYNGSASSDYLDLYSFRMPVEDIVTPQNVFKLVVSMDTKGTAGYIVVVARMARDVASWTLPLMTEDGTRLYHMEQTICPFQTRPAQLSMQAELQVEVNSPALTPVVYQLSVRNDSQYIFGIGSNISLSVTASSSVFLAYQFSPTMPISLLHVTSLESSCGVVTLENSQCPSYSHNGKRLYGIYHQTLTTQSAIPLTSKDVINGFVFIGLHHLGINDTSCRLTSDYLNDLRPADPSMSGAWVKVEPLKTFNIRVVPILKEADYILPALFPFFLYGFMYLVFFLSVAYHWYRLRSSGISLELNVPFTLDYGTTTQTSTSPASSDQLTGITEEISSDPSRDDSEGVCLNEDRLSMEFDMIADMYQHKELYRLKTRLHVKDLAQKSFTKTKRKLDLFYWNLINIIVFYGLPVIQLVLTYQKVYTDTGNGDMCYFNFLCARPLSLLSNFNNFYSNIGYVLVGLLYLLIVQHRKTVISHCFRKNPQKYKNCGIPQHFGLDYCLGIALATEGLMSACYHVCPSYTNFQFDTAFMYMIALLGMFKIHQKRHPDIHIGAHRGFFLMAIIILLSVIGVVFDDGNLWIAFISLHLVTCLCVSIYMYYMGRVRFAASSLWRLLCCKHFRLRLTPLYKHRMVLYVLINVVNWFFAIVSYIYRPFDLVTYFLVILMSNLILYILFYLLMKMWSGERVCLTTTIYLFAAAAFWAASIVFFFRVLTDWTISPAKSRELNKECILLDFYDDHDVWHFLSSLAMFFSFMVTLTVDDDLENVPTGQIVVF